MVLIGVLCLVASVSGWQASTANSSQATAFMGTWVISMTESPGRNGDRTHLG